MYETDNILRTAFTNIIKKVASDNYDNLIAQGVPLSDKDTYIKEQVIITNPFIDEAITFIWNNTYAFGLPLNMLYIFLNYNYGISFIGAIVYSITTLFNINLSSIFFTKTSEVILYIVFGACSVISMYMWLYYNYIITQVTEMILLRYNISKMIPTLS
jgi:hypothetical protein